MEDDFDKHEKWDMQEHEDLRESIARLNDLIVDNPSIGRKGMASKVDELYEVLIQSNGIIKFTGKMMAFIGVMAGLVYTLLKIFRVLK